MNTIRKVQVLVAFCAWPLALAAIFKSHKSPETIFQIVLVRIEPHDTHDRALSANQILHQISLSGVAALGILYLRRFSRKPQAAHLPIEILVDTAMGTLLIGTYIGGMNILAKHEIREWGYTYKLAAGIPQIYSNLACLVLG
jgi:hypothetical protein